MSNRKKVLPKPITLHNGKVLLYRLQNSPYWYARIKTYNGWVSRSTRQTNEHDAAIRADEFFNNPEATQPRHKQPTSFAYFADLYVEQLNRNPLPIHASYKGILENWVDPFFGRMDVSLITVDTIDEYEAWRNGHRGKLGKETVIAHHGVIKNILKIAAKHRAIERDQIPDNFRAHNTGVAPKPRPTFSLLEYREIYKKFRNWHVNAPSNAVAYKRKLLREYVLLLANSGLRPGKELNTLQWKNIDQNWIHPVTKKPYVRIHVIAGKRGSRAVIARNSARRYLRRLAALTGRTTPDDYVICTRDGEPIRSFDQMFNSFLTLHNLRYDISGEPRTLYSLRHWYITTQILYKRLPLLVLAKNCGTSVKIIERTYAKITPEAFADELSH